MADDNVSFTDAADDASNGGGKGNSAMLDLIGALNKDDKKHKGGSKNKKKNKKGKKVKKLDRYESQNFLFRVEGVLCCASIWVALTFLLFYAILALVFMVLTKGRLIHYINPWF